MLTNSTCSPGAKSKVERIPFPRANVIADKKGNIHYVSWRDIDGNVHAASRETRKDEWEEISIPRDLGREAQPVQINRAGNKVYWRADRGEQELGALVEHDLATNSFTPLFESDQVDLSFWESDEFTEEPAVGVFYPGETQYQYSSMDNEMVTAHKMLARAFKGQDIFITSSTKDGQLILLNVSSDVNPGEFYLFDRQSKKVDFMWANLSWIDPRQMANTRQIKFDARDGQQIHALLTLPVRGAIEKPPLIVIPHGGPHGIRDHWEFDQEVQLLANRGYAVLQPNFRGSAGFGEKFERLGYRKWGGVMVDDVIDATRWVVDQGLADGNQMCIYGASYGGYSAMMSAVKAPELFNCVVGYVGVYDLNIMYSDGDIPRAWGGVNYLERMLGRDENKLADASPTSHADKIKAKVFLIHGKEDRRAPIKHAITMRKALKKAGNEPEWNVYGDTGHGVWDIEKRTHMYTRLLAFFEANIASVDSVEP